MRHDPLQAAGCWPGLCVSNECGIPLFVTSASSAAQIFGGFVTDPPHLTEEKHVGTGECFLFALYPYVGCSAGTGRVRVNSRREHNPGNAQCRPCRELKVYKWTEKNRYFMMVWILVRVVR
jgi:hypothetical protein